MLKKQAGTTEKEEAKYLSVLAGQPAANVEAAAAMLPGCMPSTEEDPLNFLSVLAGQPAANVEAVATLPGCMPSAGKDKAHGTAAIALPEAALGNVDVGHSPSVSSLELLNKILESDEDDIIWIFQSLQRRLPSDLFNKLLLQMAPQPPEDSAYRATDGEMIECISPAAKSEFSPTANSWTVPEVANRGDATDEFPSAEKPRPSSFAEDQPVVQFSSFMYFCLEDEEEMHIDVMRIGNLKCRSEVQYRTSDVTAKAGQKYLSTSGTLVFEPEDNMQHIIIPILKTDRWETTVEFKVQLLEETKTNATLGFYLYETRVKIIDAGTFPTNKYKNQIQELVASGNREIVPKQSLLVEYFKMAWVDASVKSSTIKMMVADQLHNLNFLLALFLNVYAVDFVFNPGKTENDLLIKRSKDANLVFIILLTLIPFGLLHAVDYIRLSWELDAGEIQRNLLRKFLNYDESARAQLNEANLIMGMTRDSVAIVGGGYMQLLTFAKACGKLLMILVYQFVSPFAFGKTDSFVDATFWLFSFGPLVVLPVLLMSFMRCRRKNSTCLLADRNVKEDSLINCVFQTITNYRLIADYNRRPKTVRQFQNLIKDYADACTRADQVITNNVYFQKWLTQLLIAMITVGLGHLVISPEQNYPVGMFLANVSVCGSVGQCYGEIYDALLSMEKILPALLQITWLMNLPTDLLQRMNLNRSRRASTNEEREKIRCSAIDAIDVQDRDKLPLDKLSIVFKNIPFAYNSKGRVKNLHFLGTLDIQQGSLVTIVGRRGQGKTTVLKILGGVILPSVGSKGGGEQRFYIPSHLRVLHVSSEAIFFHGTLRSNLIYGVPHEAHTDARPERVQKICEWLCIPEEVTSFLGDNSELDWDDVFSQTEQSLLSLARSLIANAEVLCVHKPTLTLEAKTSQKILHVLRSFVDYRGIEQDPKSWHLRRPRTCIITISRHEALKVADQVYLVEPGRVCQIPYQCVTAELLQ